MPALVRALLLAVPALGAPAAAWSADFAATGTLFRVPVTGLRELRFQTTLRQQYDFSCGSAALATLLTHHYGLPVTEAAVFARMFALGDQPKIRREGFSLLDMQRYLADLGLRADGFELPLQALFDARLPAIVLIDTHGYQHFVVIKGDAAGRVLLGDPAAGTRALSRAAFERLWTNRLLFVIHDYHGPVRFNELADWRAAPAPPWSEGIARRGLELVTLPKQGPGDF